MSASTLPPHLVAELHTPRAPRARMSPGPSSAGVNSSPRGSPRTSERSGHAATDVEGILQAHGGDSGKAIEALLAERVSLQQQNSQLWKLIEKQRSQCATMAHDNERIRADRERANQRLVEAGLEPINTKRITNSSSAVGLGLRAEPPQIRRHNSDRDDRKATLEVPDAGPSSNQSSAQSSPREAQPGGLLPSPMARASKRESRIMFKPENGPLLGSTPPMPQPTHPIPTISTSSPATQHAPAAISSPREPTALGAVPELVDEPETIPPDSPIPEDKPADPRVVLSRSLEQPRISTDTRPSTDTADTRTVERQRNRSLPQLSAALLPYTRITIPHTTVYPNAVGRDILCFIVNITVRPPNANPVSWGVAKLFSSFVDLDTKLKAKSGKRSKDWNKTVAPLPDGRAWKDSAPSKIDQRRSALEAYLQSTLMAPLPEKSDLCIFLSTDPVQAKAVSVRKEGYLTKKVKGMGGGWKTRYFVLEGASLECLEARGGPKHSSIAITGAQIGRQNKAVDSAEDRESRHAFLIIEQNRKGPIRHILCAESDQDRDSWIDALVRHVVPDSSHERSESKSVIVTAAQPLNNAADSKFAGAPSPSLFNSMESQRLANSSPSLASQSSHNSMPPRPLVSPTTEYAPGLPDPFRQARRQSSMPPRGPPAAHTAAYLSKLSADGLNAPPGSLPDKDRERKVKSGRFWPSFGKTAEKTARPVFGVPLQESIAIANVANLPAIVFRCIEYLEHKHAEQEEGLYRLSGSSAVIKGLKDRFDTQGDVNLRQIDEHWDPHAIAGLLKTFLRELPTNLLTSDLHSRFLAVIDLVDSATRVIELNRLVNELPPPNYALLRALTAHLILIVQNSASNKMTLRNIGIVFSPTLGIPAGIFSELVSHFGPIFDAEPTAPSNGTILEEEEPVEGRKRNSILYAQGGADNLLGLAGRTLDPDLEGTAESAGDSIPDSHHSGSTHDHDITPRASGQAMAAAQVHPPRTASLPSDQHMAI